MRRIGAPAVRRKKDHDEQAIEELVAANRYLHARLSADGARTTTIDTLAWARLLNAAIGAYNELRCEVARLRRINAEGDAARCA